MIQRCGAKDKECKVRTNGKESDKNAVILWNFFFFFHWTKLCPDSQGVLSSRTKQKLHFGQFHKQLEFRSVVRLKLQHATSTM